MELRRFAPAGRLLHGELTYQVLACAYEVHKQLGPGLLENAYKVCFVRELELHRLPYAVESAIPVEYKGAILETGYRADVIIDEKVLVELKSMDRLLSIHEAQLLTYLRLSGIHVGLLINFNVPSLKSGIRRFVK